MQYGKKGQGRLTWYCCSNIACWASAGYNAAGCANVEQALRNCMDGPQPSPPKGSEVNYHLARFKDKLTSQPRKKR